MFEFFLIIWYLHMHIYSLVLQRSGIIRCMGLFWWI